MGRATAVNEGPEGRDPALCGERPKGVRTRRTPGERPKGVHTRESAGWGVRGGGRGSEEVGHGAEGRTEGPRRVE